MSYFSRFRTRIYGFDSKIKNFSIKEITDITNRGKIIQFFQKERLYDINYYVIQEGDTPETVAYNQYGDPQLHWIILLLNEIRNPLFEWPKGSVALNDHVEEKYTGSSLFLNVFVGSFQGETQESQQCRCDVESFSVSDYLISEGDEVYLKSIFGQTYEGLVHGFDAKNGELVINFPRNNFPEDSTTINLNEYAEIKIQTKTVDGSDVLVDLLPFSIQLHAKRKYSLHHFEKNSNNLEFLTPLELIPNDLYLEYDFLKEIDDGTKSLFERGDFCFGKTIFGTYLGCNPDGDSVNVDYVVTNQMHEFNENEKKRRILLPERRTVGELIKKFNTLFGQ